MLVITVEFLLGTFRAGSADDLAQAGDFDDGEWPPSPARLFAAFVAADGTGANCAVTTGEELAALESAGRPVIHADPVDRVARSRVLSRFVVRDAAAEQTVQEYPARVAVEVRPGTRISPATPAVSYVWPSVVLNEATLTGLGRRAARIGYLGCSDSPVRVRVTDAAVGLDGGVAEWLPVADDRPAEAVLPVPFDGLLAVLDAAFERFSSGVSVRRSTLPSRRQGYSTSAAAEESPSPEVVWLGFGRPVPGRWAAAVTDTLRRATLDLYQRVVGDPPAVLHGHGFTGAGYQHAHWLVLPDVGHRHATGRLYGGAVWLPPGTDPTVTEGVRAALAALADNGLVLGDGRRVDVHLYDGSARPVAATPQRWSRPSRRWVSALPVVHERWGRLTLPEVTRMCVHAGLPAPVSFRSSPVPLIDGGLGLRPAEVVRSGQERRPFSHVELLFADAVRGPVMIGRARQFGLGLMAPIPSLVGAGRG